ncbi:hypothetical protein [Streptomyces celluloflavus]|uniref:hypothetical protein n=1 Tax=Streptomyces celluloflavus TaxID=58344 RepID=UPI00345FFEA6|nr:hypothetical protein OG717_30305 [Streptomyces celluloflavus]
MIESLDAFTVTVEYGPSHTTFLLHPKGQREPTARMHKDSAYDARSSLRVYTGARLDEPGGYVSEFEAMTAQRVKMGTIRYRERTWRPDEWTFTQHDLGVLSGLPEGLGSTLRHSFPLRAVLDHFWGDALFSYRLRFRSPESEGFALVRLAGVRARYKVTVRDPRISRLLVLACVTQFNTYATSDPRKAAQEYLMPMPPRSRAAGRHPGR